MSFPLPRNTHVAVLALVSALLILKVAKRAPEAPLLKTLGDVGSQAGADSLAAGQQLPEPEYDIIIVGGGEFAFVFFPLGLLSDQNLP